MLRDYLFPLIKLAKKLKASISHLCPNHTRQFPLIKLAKKLKVESSLNAQQNIGFH